MGGTAGGGQRGEDIRVKPTSKPSPDPPDWVGIEWGVLNKWRRRARPGQNEGVQKLAAAFQCFQFPCIGRQPSTKAADSIA